jgi:DNA-binding transcriptional LysR family regulator
MPTAATSRTEARGLRPLGGRLLAERAGDRARDAGGRRRVLPRDEATAHDDLLLPVRSGAVDRARRLEDPRAALALARTGAGLFQTYRFLAERAVARGELVEVLEAHAGRTRRFSLVHPKHPPLTRAARVVVDAALAAARRR